MSARRKVCVARTAERYYHLYADIPDQTAEIISLLYEATQGPAQPPEAPALNPTGGVKVKQPLRGLQFKKDPTRPGGGVFVARDTTGSAVDKNLPEGTIVNEEQERELTLFYTCAPAKQF